ncbi:BlaI/MecI/CopY family transcriptional regulator [Streptomyces phaeochromogenes]|uniref:BlaI/MecI/CopY family transcriptional regulator n=1 Tax=Streptomyces phaeochromogenes TaxID=1923 RepID=UPI002DDB3C97|nr:BlaI/MecI/CopY family transcriptional regulator [Streptomyces phaeochromogenes]WRZ27031.1 BlaI/MecI/CopY family transcriptional regulator [Streptomyces phaeochromogenes]
MSEVESATTELKTQYAAQVAADLERNTKEQERIGAEVAALQEQLSALQHDQSLLVNLQRTLGTESLEAGSSEEESVTAAKPSLPRQASAETKSGRRKKATAAKPKKAAAKTAEPKESSPAAKLPTLVELIHNHLGRQSEPRSSAEISTALTQAHPDRDIKPKVVRTTVEGLVAKGHVQRTKQGSSVFYTAAETPAADNSAEQEPVTA